MIKATCEVQISRVYGADSHEVEIRIVDTVSRKRFFEAHIPMKHFGDILFGRPMEVSAELTALATLGMRHEVKEELLFCDPRNDAERSRALRAAEVDGWKARPGDIDNPNRFVRGKGVNVVFFRNVGKSYVEQEQENDSQS